MKIVMELLKKEAISNFIFLFVIFSFGTCQNLSNTGESAAITNCGIIIRPDPVPSVDTPLDSGDWPWFATIYKVRYSGLVQSCIGTLVSLRAVLTTANCLYGYENSINIDDIVVRLGQTNRSDWNGRTVITSTIRSIITHPRFESFGERDIAIIELENDIAITDFVKPACLWAGISSRTSGNFGFEARWGVNTAYRTSARFVNNDVCFPLKDNAVNNFDDYEDDVTFETTFCAGQKGGPGSCFSNTGAGLLMKQNGRWMLRGILVRECSLNYKLYVDIAAVFDWIQLNLPKPDATIGVFESELKICGKSNFVEPDLVREAQWETTLNPSEWPWMAAIYYSVGQSIRMKCLGTLISSKTILTAANCANNTQDSVFGRYGFFVRLGQRNIADVNQDAAITSAIDRYEIHPNFTTRNLDIAIVVLTEKIRRLSLSLTKSDDICGQIYPGFNYTQLAYRGTEIERGTWPWLVAIYKNRRNVISFLCAGTLISKTSILSAAHCFFDTDGELTSNNIQVYLGLHEIHKTDDDGVVSPSIRNIAIHKDYNTRRKIADADIAIITLNEPISFTIYIRPACVWTDSDATYDQIGSVVGWGRYEAGEISEKPRQVYAQIVDPLECLRSNIAFNDIASRRNFCAGNKDDSGPCKGDSGSGLLVEKQGRLYVRGIVSTSLLHQSFSCNLAQYVVYSDISRYLDWIRSVIDN